jgi:hypothetical protein
MALDACPVADPPAGGSLVIRAGLARTFIIVVGLLRVAVPARAADEPVAGLVAPYLKARSDGTLGAVAAKAFAEPTRPNAGPAPQPSVSITLLPYSAALEAELDSVKSGLRDSLDGYVHAIARIETARVDYERALLGAGAGELVRTQMTDGQGMAQLGELPVGDWLVLAWREGGHLSKRFRLRDTEASKYPNISSNVTYSTVTLWRTRITVRAGETVEVTMTDRNVWLTAARQEGGTPITPQPRPQGSPNKRR